MLIDEKEFDRLAMLSALSFSHQKKQESLISLNKVVDFAKKIKVVQVNNAEILSESVTINQLREDVVKPSMAVEKLLANAPEKESSAIIVPKVVD